MAKGIYTPKNPSKYLGDPRKIRFLSSWELRMMSFCDDNPEIIAWASEEIKIHYFNPIKKKVCTYLPDFLIKYRDQTGKVLIELVEIKPSKQAPSTKSLSNSKISNYDKVQLVINQCKFAAATAFCEARGIKFRVITENSLFRF